MKERELNIYILVANRKCGLSGHEVLTGAKKKDLRSSGRRSCYVQMLTTATRSH